MTKVNEMLSGIESIGKDNMYGLFSYKKHLLGHQMNLTDGKC